MSFSRILYVNHLISGSGKSLPANLSRTLYVNLFLSGSGKGAPYSGLDIFESEFDRQHKSPHRYFCEGFCGTGEDDGTRTRDLQIDSLAF